MKEVQRFRSWVLFILMALLLIPLVLIAVLSIFSAGNSSPIDFGPVLILSVITLPLVVLLLTMRLETELSQQGVSYRYAPFHGRKREIAWEQVSEVYIRTYNSLAEFGGWGIRFGGFNMKNLLLNVSGKTGLQLVLRDGRRILIGTRRAEEMRQLLRTFKAPLVES